MRKDLGKCIIEAPRHNSSASSAKVRHYGKIVHTDDGLDYDGFTRLPVSRKQEGYNKRLGYKSFTDKLGPLTRYLESSCGRPWNDVYSEIAYNLGRYTKAEGIRHIINDHIDVETNTWRGDDGHVWAMARGGPPHRIDVIEVGWRFRSIQFYVDPDTGILCKSKAVPRKYTHMPVEHIQLTPGTEYRLINGVWYWQEYHEYEVSTPYKSPYSDRILYHNETRRDIVCKRQVGKKELKKTLQVLLAKSTAGR